MSANSADIDECLSPQACSATFSPSEAYTCVNTDGSYACTCRAGYRSVDATGGKKSCVGECCMLIHHMHHDSSYPFLICSVVQISMNVRKTIRVLPVYIREMQHVPTRQEVSHAHALEVIQWEMELDQLDVEVIYYQAEFIY